MPDQRIFKSEKLCAPWEFWHFTSDAPSAPPAPPAHKVDEQAPMCPVSRPQQWEPPMKNTPQVRSGASFSIAPEKHLLVFFKPFSHPRHGRVTLQLLDTCPPYVYLHIFVHTRLSFRLVCSWRAVDRLGLKCLKCLKWFPRKSIVALEDKAN